jgi:elongation factor 1-gamma
MKKGLRIFSYLPNPRVWKAEIAAKISGIPLEILGDKPSEIPNWLWDVEPKKINDSEKKNLSLLKKKEKEGLAHLYLKQINS